MPGDDSYRAAQPSPAELERRGRVLYDVLLLAAALPSRHERELRYPRLPAETAPTAHGQADRSASRN